MCACTHACVEQLISFFLEGYRPLFPLPALSFLILLFYRRDDMAAAVDGVADDMTRLFSAYVRRPRRINKVCDCV